MSTEPTLNERARLLAWVREAKVEAEFARALLDAVAGPHVYVDDDSIEVDAASGIDAPRLVLALLEVTDEQIRRASDSRIVSGEQYWGQTDE